VPLSWLPLGRVPLGRVPLGRVPLGRVPRVPGAASALTPARAGGPSDEAPG